MGILVIGSSNTDLVAHASRLPAPGETVIGDSFFVNPGGKGANQAVAAARLSNDVTFCCKIGTDDYGAAALAGFRKEGIDTTYVFTTDKHPSGVALISVDEKGENCIVVAPGANMQMTTEDIDRVGDFGRYPIVLAQLETPLDAIERAAVRTKEAGGCFILNPAPACELSKDLLAKVDILTPNETEAGLLSGIVVSNDDDAVRAAEKLCSFGVKTVIITMGSRGSLIYEDGKSEFVDAFKVKAVDTTAAGDTFNGALAVALSEGKSVVEAARFASAASSIAVTRPGAQASAPTREEVDNKLQQ